MLCDKWLFSDFDGTLVAAPHAAKGRYVSIKDSPCFIPIKRWLLNGGNICVITTADTRVIEQLYIPLRDCLAQEETLSSTSGSSVNVSAFSRASFSRGVQRAPASRGKLLLSLYTGTVLYFCTSKRVMLVPQYIDRFHVATKESVRLSQQYGTPLSSVSFQDITTNPSEENQIVAEGVQGTYISLEAGKRVFRIVGKAYLRYVTDILQGNEKVVECIQYLSWRYKKMWTMILSFLHDAYSFTEAEQNKDRDDPSVREETKRHKEEQTFMDPFSSEGEIIRPGSASSVEWKIKYLLERPTILHAFGILRCEFVKEIAYDGDIDRHREVDKAEPKIVQMLLEKLSANVQKQLSHSAKKIAHNMAHLLGVEYDELERNMNISGPPCSTCYSGPSSTCSESRNIVQIIVLGIPISLYSTYLLSAFPELIGCGVHCIPQPNSVVFSKLGVGKSTVLHYLLGKGLKRCFQSKEADKANYAGVVSTANAVALGDNPQSTDFELTNFQDLIFVSLEKASQRTERHERIRRRLYRAAQRKELHVDNVLPDGRPAPSLEDLQRSLWESGPMMDDRLRKNIWYLGGEERGTAALLTCLMNEFGVPSCVDSPSLCEEVSFRERIDGPLFQDALHSAKKTASSSLVSQDRKSKL